MEMTGEYRISAKREMVWSALNDPDILRQAIPGCRSMEKHGETRYVATVLTKIGPVKATFKGRVELSELNPPSSYVISGEGQGGTAGFAKGSANVSLLEDGDATILHYEVNAQVGGKLAQIGQRLINSTAKKMADDFFRTFSELVSSDITIAGESNQSVSKSETPISSSSPQTGLSPWVWMGGLIIAALILIAIADVMPF